MSEPFTSGDDEEIVHVSSSVAGPNVYAIAVQGEVYAPTRCDGQKAVFDPDAAQPQRGDIVAVWIHGDAQPRVVRLHLALPPPPWNENGELIPTLVVDTGRGIRTMPMHKVKAVHRMVAAAV